MSPPLLVALGERYSNYVVYVDESGDHGMEALDSNYPLFVLAFCVFHKTHYAQKVVPSVASSKFKHFVHDTVVLHEHEIRKEKGNFRFVHRLQKQEFLDELTGIIDLTTSFSSATSSTRRACANVPRLKETPTIWPWGSAWKRSTN